ncbi:hypothetical protein J2847_005116 [Azospirillum agricola]|uniref:hypothetical protein n=1 Tax=Azospirillum agricola TaxID=1720247 RepID=UPI001AE83F48|nr:hypothetical protein [Azospirillum agricola]MBP2231797.1 hypothetical protein [Azospirillum agricola]
MSSIIRRLHEDGKRTPGVRPEVSAATAGLAPVEARYGLAQTLDAILSTYLTVTCTLGATYDVTAIDAGIVSLEAAAHQLRTAKAAMLGGTAPEGAIVKLGATTTIHAEGRA